MKKFVIKTIRKILFIVLLIIKFPASNIKNAESELEEISKQYNNKKVSITNNNLILDKNINLTIIVPVYNTAKLLEKCVNSILNQKTKYIYEIILINDGSTDNSLNILKEFEKNNKNIRILSQENRGISETRNLGIKNIKGEYVAFIDSDDFIEDNYIEELLDNAYENNADIVRCNYYEYDVNRNNVIKTGKEQNNQVLKSGLGKKILDFKGYPWGGIYKSSLWNDIQFPNGYWYEDMIIRMILFRKGKVFSYINDKLYYYCLHSNNISKKIEKTKDIRCLDHFFLIQELCNLSKKLSIEEDVSLYWSMLYEYSVVLWLRTRGLDKNLRKEVFFEACNIIISITNDKFDLEIEEKIAIDIFKRKDYVKWQLYAIYKLLAVKYGVD